MLGAAQEAVLARDTSAASTPGPNQTVWQQYLGGLVMLVRLVSLISLPHNTILEVIPLAQLDL